MKKRYVIKATGIFSRGYVRLVWFKKSNEKDETTNCSYRRIRVSVRYINDKNEIRIIRKSTLSKEYH